MKNIIEILSAKFKGAVTAAFPELAAADLNIDLAQSSNEKFGHYQFNGAMRLSKLVKQNPRQVAEAILKGIAQDAEGAPFIAKLEIAGPGFINITLDSRFLSHGADLMVRDRHLAIDLPKHRQRIVIDFSSPNTAKEMHVGHLRSTIIGDSLARLFEFLGHDVLRLNHVGDWGTAFGMLIAYMKEEVPQVASGQIKTTLTDLVGWYKESKKRFDEDPQFKKSAQMEVVALQGEDPAALQGWQLICEISRRAYQEIYDILGVRLQERGESFYNPMLKSVVDDLEAKGLITLSDGAKCIFLEGFQNREGEPLPLIVQKSDGGYNYATTDLAALKHRIEVEKADRVIVVTDAGQAQHFQMFIGAAEKAGYLDPKKVQVDHVTFGMVLGPDGKKFKTRSGETERLIDLLTTAVAKAKEILLERRLDLSSEEIDQLAVKLGIGAVKYADLSGHRMSDYLFSYERMLKFEGNTAAFLMYAYVRVAGIKRKVNVEIEKVKSESYIALEHPSEVALGLHLLQFSEALETVSCDLLPNRLTDYLYSLAEKFNGFFRDCRVEGTPQQNSRLLLCETVAAVMKQGLEILGLETVEKM